MKVIIGLILMFGFQSLVTAQTLTANVKWTKKECLQESQKGHFQWVMPSEITKAVIEKSASYYTSYFKYDFDASKQLINIYTLDDSENSRRVVLRFLGANQISQIVFENENYELYDFYEKHMKLKTE